MGEPLAKFPVVPSVSETDTTLNEEIKYLKNLSGGTPCKILVFIFSCATFVGFPKEVKSGQLDQVGAIRKQSTVVSEAIV